MNEILTTPATGGATPHVAARPVAAAEAATRVPVALAALRLIRPTQWVKNGLVLAPLVFAGRVADPRAVTAALTAMLLFTLASALVYVVNDIADREQDARHPTRSRTRPIAAGWIGVARATIIGGALAVVLAAGLIITPAPAIAIAAFLGINVAYSLGLKRLPGVELACVASGYLLRAYAGAAAIDVPLSNWMLLTTATLSLYLAASKRLAELRSSGAAGRVVLASYSPRMLRATASLSALTAAGTFTAYALFANPVLTATVPIVVFAVARCDYLLRRRGLGESPEDLLWSDLPLLGAVLLWAATCVLLVGQVR